MEGLIRCPANYVPLTPISFLERSALVYGDRFSVIYGDVIYTWKQTLIRCTKLASALTQLGISYGDVVSFFSSYFSLSFMGFILSLIPKSSIFVWSLFLGAIICSYGLYQCLMVSILIGSMFYIPSVPFNLYL